MSAGFHAQCAPTMRLAVARHLRSRERLQLEKQLTEAQEVQSPWQVGFQGAESIVDTSITIVKYWLIGEI